MSGKSHRNPPASAPAPTRDTESGQTDAQDNSVARDALPDVEGAGELPDTLAAASIELSANFMPPPGSDFAFDENRVPAATLASIDDETALWRDQVRELHAALIPELSHAADLAAEGLAWGDPATYRDACLNVKDAFFVVARAVGLAEAARADAAGVRADLDTQATAELEALVGPKLAAAIDDAFRTSGFARGFTPAVYDGGFQPVPIPGGALFAPPPPGVDPRAVKDGWQAWHERIHAAYVDAVGRAAEVRQFADALMAVAEDPEGYGIRKREEEGLGARYSPTVGTPPADAPQRQYDGRARQYLDAVFAAHASAPWAAWYGQNAAHTRDQIGLEDTQGESDFERLDGAIDRILETAGSDVMDDDVVMEMLHVAATPAERTYLLQRLMHSHGPDGERMYFAIQRRLDGEEVGEFDAYREQTGHFGSDGVGGEVDPTSVSAALDQSWRAAPGALAAGMYGAAASVPIAGDVVEGAYGEDVRAYIDGLHQHMGVEEHARRASTDAGMTTGKIVGAIASMAIGGAAASGIRTLHTARTAQLVRTGAATAYTAMDIANGGYQFIMGRKLNGDEIAWGERLAALVGAVGGIQALSSALRAQKTAMDTLKYLTRGDRALMGGVRTEASALDELVALEKMATEPLLKVALSNKVAELGLTVAGGAAKTAAAYTKPGGAEEVGRMSDLRVLDLCRKIARANAPISPVQRIRDLVLDDGRMRTTSELWPYMDALRAALADYRDLAPETDNELALPLSVLSLGASG